MLSLSSLATVCPGLDYCGYNASQFPRHCPPNTLFLFGSIALDFSISTFTPLQRVKFTVAASRLLQICPDQLFVQHSTVSALPPADAQSSLNDSNQASNTIISLLASCIPYTGGELVVPNCLYQYLDTILGSEIVLSKANVTAISWSVHSGSLPWSFIKPKPKRLKRSTTVSDVNSDLETGSGLGSGTGSGIGSGDGDFSDMISIPIPSLDLSFTPLPTLAFSSFPDPFMQSTSIVSSLPLSSSSSLELDLTIEPTATSSDVLFTETTIAFPLETDIVEPTSEITVATDIIEPTTDIVEPTPEITDIVEPTTEITDIVEPTTEITDVVEPTTDIVEPTPEITDIVEPTPEITDIVELTTDVVQPTPEMTDVVEPTPEITDIVELTTDIVEPTPEITDIVELTTDVVQPTPEITDIIEFTSEITDIIEPTVSPETSTGVNILTPISEPVSDTAFLTTSQDIEIFTSIEIEPTDSFFPLTSETLVMSLETEDILTMTTPFLDSSSVVISTTSIGDLITPSPSITIVASTPFVTDIFFTEIVPSVTLVPSPSPVLTTTDGGVLTPFSEPVSDTEFPTTSEDIDIFTSNVEATDSFFLSPSETEDFFTMDVTTTIMPSDVFTTSVEASSLSPSLFPSITIIPPPPPPPPFPPPTSLPESSPTIEIFSSEEFFFTPSFTELPSPTPSEDIFSMSSLESSFLASESVDPSDTDILMPMSSAELSETSDISIVLPTPFPSFVDENSDFIIPSTTSDLFFTVFTSSLLESFSQTDVESTIEFTEFESTSFLETTSSSILITETIKSSEAPDFTDITSLTPFTQVETIEIFPTFSLPTVSTEIDFTTDLLLPASSSVFDDSFSVLPTPDPSSTNPSLELTEDFFTMTDLFSISIEPTDLVEPSDIEATDTISISIEPTETISVEPTDIEATDTISVEPTDIEATDTISVEPTETDTISVEPTDIEVTDTISVEPTDIEATDTISVEPTDIEATDTISVEPTDIEATDTISVEPTDIEATDTISVEPTDIEATDTISVEPTDIEATDTISVEPTDIEATDTISVEPTDIETTDTISVEPTDIEATDTISVEPTDIETTDTISVEPTDIEATDTISVEPTDIEATDTISVEPTDIEVTDTISVEPTDIEATDTILVEPTDIEATDTISVEPTDIEATDTISVEPTDIEATDTISVEPTNIEATDTISVEPTDIEPSETISVEPTEELSETIFLESSETFSIPESFSFFTDMTSIEFSTPALPSFTSVSLTPSPSPLVPSLSVINPIGVLFLNEGELFSIQIPEDTFYDPEDGLTSNLSLSLLHSNGQPVEAASWVQLVENPYTLRALPLSSEVEGGIVTNYLFLLLAEDSDGNNVTSLLSLRIIPHFGIQTSNFVTIFVDGNFTQFQQNFTTRFVLSQGIADPDPSSIYFREFRNGSIAVTYTNSSIAFHDCPAFYTWFNAIYTENNYTSLYRTKIAPFVPINQPILTGPCVKVSVSYSALPPTDGIIITQPFSLLTILLAIIIPMVALACLLLLLGGLACVLYRRRSKREKAGGITFKGRFPAMLPGELEEVPYRYRAPNLLTEELPRRENRRRGYFHLLHSSSSPPLSRQPVISSLDEVEDDEELVDLPIITLQNKHRRKDPPEYRLPLLDD